MSEGKIELSVEKSEQQAVLIGMIRSTVSMVRPMLDMEYLREAHSAANSQASLQEAWPFPQTQDQSKRTRSKNAILKALILYIEALDEDLETSAKAKKEKDTMDELFRSMGVKQ